MFNSSFYLFDVWSWLLRVSRLLELLGLQPYPCLKEGVWYSNTTRKTVLSEKKTIVFRRAKKERDPLFKIGFCYCLRRRPDLHHVSRSFENSTPYHRFVDHMIFSVCNFLVPDLLVGLYPYRSPPLVFMHV